MELKEKLIRKINVQVQKSSMSEETKMLTANTVLAIDICNKLSAIASDSNGSYAQRKQLNEKLHHIMKELEGIPE